MASMNENIVHRVNKLPKPSKASEALQPVFECISNAIHATEDLFSDNLSVNGEISVKITKQPKIKIIVTDNGIGLDNDRFKAFCTTDTDFKLERGGKGVGRLLWLDAFKTVQVESFFSDGEISYRRSFKFRLTDQDQIFDDNLEKIPVRAPGTTVTLTGLRSRAYVDHFPKGGATIIQQLSSHFFADFIMGRSPKILINAMGKTGKFPDHVQKMCLDDRGISEIETENFGTVILSNFICTKEASRSFEGNHQLHFVANGRTVTTIKIDGLLGLGLFGSDKNLVYHGCVSGVFLDERVNQERTQFSFDEKTVTEISKCCASKAREAALAHEVAEFESFRRAKMEDFLENNPSYYFEDVDDLIKRVPLNYVKDEQFAQALVPTKIRRNIKRREQVQQVVKTLDTNGDVTKNLAEAIIATANEIHLEEQRQLTEYVVRRKLVLDFLRSLVNRIREKQNGKDKYHLEKTLHQFICPMKIRGDDPSKIEASKHDLWVIDERLAFTKYFASDIPFSKILEDSKSGERPDVFIFDRLHGLSVKGDEDQLRRVMLIEFKKPGKTDYSQNDMPENQIIRYLAKLVDGKVTGYKNDRIRIAKDCVFSCYFVADIIGLLETSTGHWQTTSNGRGRWMQLNGKYRGFIEIIEWRDLINDALSRNRAFIETAGIWKS